MRSTSSPLAVSMMIGVRSLAARRRRQIDRPSSPGSIRSSTIRSTVSRVSMRFSALRVLGEQDLEAFLRQVAAQQVADARVVVDDGDAVRALVGGGAHGDLRKFVTTAILWAFAGRFGRSDHSLQNKRASRDTLLIARPCQRRGAGRR